MYLAGSSDYEKAQTINVLLNELYFQKLEMDRMFFSYLANPRERSLEHVYKFRAVFSGELAPEIAPYSISHSMLANLVLDYPSTKGELDIITNLRRNYKDILAFAEDNSTDTTIKVKNCNLKYGRQYRELLKHILVSDKFISSVIDVNSIIKENDNMTFVISKRKRG